MFRGVWRKGSIFIFLTGFVFLMAGGSSSADAGAPCGKKIKKTSASQASLDNASQSESKACHGKQSTSCLKEQAQACCRSKSAKARAGSIKNIATDLPYHEYKRLVFEGEYVCGKCNLKKISFCQGFIKTSGGDLYPLLNNIHLKEIKKIVHSNASAKFEITSYVKLINGVKYLEVKNFKSI